MIANSAGQLSTLTHSHWRIGGGGEILGILGVLPLGNPGSVTDYNIYSQKSQYVVQQRQSLIEKLDITVISSNGGSFSGFGYLKLIHTITVTLTEIFKVLHYI